MADEQEVERGLDIQKWAPYFVAGVLVLAIGFYVSQFHGGLSTEQGTWGEFGDFVGGAVNPIIGFFTIWLLAVSLRQNHKALSQARAELELTRIAIDDAKKIQATTEMALKQQISIAEEAKDMSNAISLMKHFHTVIGECQDLERQYSRAGVIGGGMSIDVVRDSKQNAIVRLERLAEIIEVENQKLVSKYKNR